MRILHLTTEYPPLVYGGLGTAVGGLARASARGGMGVAVLLVRGSGSAAYRQPPDEPGESGPRPLDRSGVQVYPTTWEAALDDALRLTRSWRPHILHLHVFWLWPIAAALRERTGLPLVYTVHSLDLAEYELGNGPDECLAQWEMQLTVLRRADLVIAPSRSERGLVLEYVPELAGRVVVAGHGLDDEVLRVPPPQRAGRSDPTVLFVGRFVDRKGIRELLAAIPEVLESVPRARFVLSGGHRGTTAGEMDRWWRPRSAAADGRIRFTGWLGGDAVSEWYRNADILVVPSWYEPFGMVVLEGMAHALAIAASNVGGPGEILEDGRTGLLFSARDTPSLVGALVRLASEPDLRRRLGVAARLEVRCRWTWPIATAQTRAAYERAARHLQPQPTVQ
jgi:glycogen synthase